MRALIRLSLFVLATLGLARTVVARDLEPTAFLDTRAGKRLEKKLGSAEATAFLTQVRSAPIQPKWRTWVARFVSERRGTTGILEMLIQAHQMDPSGEMEAALCSHARAYRKTRGAVNQHSTPDERFLERAQGVREKLDKLEHKPGVVIFFDGPDGAGKTSISRLLGEALKGPYQLLPTVPHLGKPDPARPWGTWVREQLGVPAEAGTSWVRPGEVMFVDRSLLGEVVYSRDPTAAARVEALEAELQRTYGVKFLHVVLVPSKEKVTQTYGKRLARALYLSEVPLGAPPVALVSAADGPAYTSFGQVAQSFRAAAERFSANTLLVDASHRNRARHQVLDWVGHSIQGAAGAPR
jgi:hypothetical protein